MDNGCRGWNSDNSFNSSQVFSRLFVRWCFLVGSIVVDSVIADVDLTIKTVAIPHIFSFF